ncbi:BCL3 protein, partial [Acromyrmex insinuator]
MDSPPEPTPVKKRCISTNGSKMRPLECVRQFQLPQQFPSTIKQAMKSDLNIAEPTTPTIMCPDTVKVSSNVENQVPCNLQKLRILSPGGRDLGEFNVKMCSADSSKGNTITITKSNCKPNDKPLTLPLSPVFPAKSIPRILRQDSSKIPRRNLMEVMPCSRTIPWINNTNVLHQQKSTTKDKKLLSSQNLKEVEKQMPNNIKHKINSSDKNNIPLSGETSTFNQNATLTQKCKTSLASGSIKNITNVTSRSILRHNTKHDNTQSKHSKAEFRNDKVVIDSYVRPISESRQIKDVSTNMQSNVQSKDCSKDLPQKNLSDRLNIIKKAMDSVSDNELRELALKALADCGIGIERHVPIPPPEDHKAVHDTQVQTVVFGLLDPKSFILINKDLNDIHRLNQITLYDMPNDENLLVNNPHSNNSISKDSNVIEQESPFDLDSFMEQFWKEDSDALKMKETLSMTRVRCNSLLEHLQRDFENVKRYDQNGMLNIHNAVVSDNIYLVQRQLMVLQYYKQSIDILTENGMTSLELAIKYDVCSEIVKLLLDTGAQPVIPKSLHESAVIIASKRSSPLLSMLVSRISDPKLLDQIDSEGLAALHYCSMRGNLKGVKALLAAGATIDLKDMKSGRTPLFHAVDNDCTSVKKALLKAGAVTNIANFAGQMPLCIFSDSKNLSFGLSLTKDTT